ncbi:hypothetical protein [Thalassospira lucentensis]|nr:hypothetical protein [Thalassospira lucentensis]WOI13172.1 hypothetical protein R1T41_12590 [Thalassospira lucentensis]
MENAGEAIQDEASE